MAFGLRRRGPTKFQRAADGSMTLVEHFRELRTRLFRASLAILVGFGIGMWLSIPVFELLKIPYCNLQPDIPCDENQLIQLEVAAGFLLRLKIALWVGLIVASPVWLYQLWAFIAPGLHRNERRYAYLFTAIAVPLFVGGAALAYFVVDKGLQFLLDAGVTGTTATLEVTAYVSFVTNLILIFGVAFEFPLLLLMLNVAGIASAQRLASWWRVIVFLSFAFAAIATPDPGPFGMTLLALSLCLLYAIALGVAFLNDRRRGRRDAAYAGLDDDEASPLEDDREPLERGAPVEMPTPVAGPLPLERRYDDTT